MGAATRDVDTADPRGWRLGGTVCYASLAAARLGVAVRALVGVDAQAATAAELAVLRDAGVDVALHSLERGPVFENSYDPAGRVQVAHETSDLLPATALPRDWRDSGVVLLAPVAAELDSEWAAVPAPGTYVALAWQGLLRDASAGDRVRRLVPALSPIVKRADALFVSAEDLPPATQLAPWIAPGQQLFVTHGRHGALVLRAGGGRYVPALPPRDAVDATGAGDVFIGAWLASRALAPAAREWQHLAVAAALASLSVRTRTLAELPRTRELCEVLLRLRDRHRR